MLSIVFGLAAAGIGLWGMWIWNEHLISLLKGLLPLSLFFAGLISIFMGSFNFRRTSPGSKKGS